MDKYDFVLPDITCHQGVKEIMENAPMKLAQLEKCVSEEEIKLASLKAKIIIGNPSEKQFFLRALTDSDDLVKKTMTEVSKWKALQTMWNSAFQSAKTFYRSSNQI